MSTTDDRRQRRWTYAGHFFTAIAMAMTFSAGWQLGGDSAYYFANLLIGLLFAGVTWAAAHMLTEIDGFWSEGRRTAACGLMAVFGLFFVAEYCAHTLFNVGHRATDIEHANLQNTRFDDTQSQKSELADKKKLLEGRLDKLEAQYAWMSTKPSAAWKAEIANLEGDKVYARSKQCSNVTKADSRSLCDKLAELRANLAVAEDHDKTSEMLAATETALLNTREKSAGMAKGESSAAEQTKVIAQLASLDLAPSASSLAWTNLGISGFLSLVSSIAAAVSNWLAAGIKSVSVFAARVKTAVVEANPLQAQIDALNAKLDEMVAALRGSVQIAPAASSAPAQPIHLTETYNVTDDKRIREIQARCLAEADRIERKAA
jgi:hypothetical protein